MELKVVIDKKFAFMIFGAILILAGAIYGYAQGGSTPNPGHLANEISIECKTFEGIYSEGGGNAYCGDGYKVISGFCTGTHEHLTYINPTGNYIQCYPDTSDGDQLVHPFAFCCNFS